MALTPVSPAKGRRSSSSIALPLRSISAISCVTSGPSQSMSERQSHRPRGAGGARGREQTMGRPPPRGAGGGGGGGGRAVGGGGTTPPRWGPRGAPPPLAARMLGDDQGQHRGGQDDDDRHGDTADQPRAQPART